MDNLGCDQTAPREVDMLDNIRIFGSSVDTFHRKVLKLPDNLNFWIFSDITSCESEVLQLLPSLPYYGLHVQMFSH